MNVLPFDQQVRIIAALTEGCSSRSTERFPNLIFDLTTYVNRRFSITRQQNLCCTEAPIKSKPYLAPLSNGH
jgi:hypothetical protein